jgi:hypothetical protein
MSFHLVHVTQELRPDSGGAFFMLQAAASPDCSPGGALFDSPFVHEGAAPASYATQMIISSGYVTIPLC